MKEDKVNELIDQAIDSLVDDSPEKGAEALQELALTWALAGIPMGSFLDIRKFIIKQAIDRTSAFFIQEKLKVQEQILKESRDASRKIIIT